MMKNEKEKMVQNLKDAGCDDSIVTAYIYAVNQGEQAKGLRILTQHRQCLMVCYHECEKQIDCLDYLIYQIKKCPKER